MAPPEPIITDAYLDRVAQIESSGRADATNPVSSATGMFQFVDQTWREQAVLHLDPAEHVGLTDQELLDLRLDPDKSRRVARGMADKDGQAIAKAGFDPLPHRLYMAHFLGRNGALAVLGTDPDRPLREGLERVSENYASNVINNHPGMISEDMTVGEFDALMRKKVGLHSGGTVVEEDGGPDPLARDVGTVGLGEIQGLAAPGLIIPPDEVEEVTTIQEQLGSAFRLVNISANAVDAATGESFEDDPDYDVFEHLTTGEALEATQFAHIGSQDELDYIRQRREVERNWEGELASGPLNPFVAAIIAGVVDPINFIPFVGGYSAATIPARIIRGAAAATAATAAGEVVLQAAQETRTAEDAAADLLMSTIIGGGFAGAGVAARTGLSALGSSQNQLASLMRNTSGSVQAPTVLMPINPANNTLAPGLGVPTATAWLARKGLGAPGIALLGSVSPAAREASRRLVHTGAVTKDMVLGTDTGVIAMETQVKAFDTHQADLSRASKAGYNGYKRRVRAAGQKPVSRKAFYEQITRAGRDGRAPGVEPEALAVADMIHDTIIDPMTKRLVSSGALDPALLKNVTSKRWWPRSYRKDKIEAKPKEFKNRIERWLLNSNQVGVSGQPLTPAEAAELASATLNKIRGIPDGQTLNLGFASTTTKGTLKQRTLLIPDDQIADFLEPDAQINMARWMRSVVPEFVIRENMGNKAPDEALAETKAAIAKDYDTLDPSGKAVRQRDQDMRMVDALFNRIRGTDMPGIGGSAGMKMAPGTENTLAALRSLNVATKMGGVMISNLGDAGRVVMKEGVARTFGFALRDLMQGFKANRIGLQLAQRHAVALETEMGRRTSAMLAHGDREIVTGAGEAMARNATGVGNLVMKLSLLQPMIDRLKAATSTLAVSGVLDAAEKVAAGKPLTARETLKAQLSGLSMTDLRGIAAESQHWLDLGAGARNANAEAWGDQILADKFWNAILQDVDDTVITPGEGDFPLWAGTAWGKSIAQFKRFTIAAAGRITMQSAQRAVAGDYLSVMGGMIASLGMGAAVVHLKDLAAGEPGRERSTGQLAADIVDRSGLAAPFFEMNSLASGFGIDPVAMATGAEPTRQAARGNFVGKLAGPTFGTFEDMRMTAFSAVQGATLGESVTQNDARRMARLIPGRNLFWMQSAFNATLDAAIQDLPERR